MSELIKAEIVTPDGVFYAKPVYMMTMPGCRGEFGVLAGHVTSMVGLQAGIAAVYDQHMKIIEQIFINGGFVEVTGETITILVEEASNFADHNLADATLRLISLQTSLANCGDDGEKTKLANDINTTEKLIELLKS